MTIVRMAYANCSINNSFTIYGNPTNRMKLYYIGFYVWIFLLVVMLTGCSEFEAKIEEKNRIENIK